MKIPLAVVCLVCSLTACGQEQGTSVPEDIGSAAEQGDATPQDEAEAALKRYRSLPHDTEELRRYRKAAEHGDASAQFDLAEMYHQSPSVGDGTLIDRYLWYPKASEADKWYRKAAKQGHIQAQIRLGEMYFHGEGMLKDYDEAVRWYRMAAEQGHIDTQLKLASHYEQGLGLPQDYALARSSPQGQAGSD